MWIDCHSKVSDFGTKAEPLLANVLAYQGHLWLSTHPALHETLTLASSELVHGQWQVFAVGHF